MSYTIKNVEQFVAFMQEQVDNGSTVADAFEAFQNSLPKIPGDGEGVVIILNYGPKSHAMFGADTKPVKDGLMALNTEGKKDVVSFNGKLEFGAGWVITNKTKLKTVLEFLDENEVAHTEIEREAFVSGEVGSAAPAAKKAPKAKAPAKGKVAPKGKTAKKAASDDEEEEAPEKDEGKELTKMKIEELKNILRESELSTTGTKEVLIARILSDRKGNDATPARSTGKSKVSATKTKAPAKGKSTKTEAAPKGKSAKSKPAPKAKASTGEKLVAKKNDQGNYIEEETGLAFVEAPVGSGGRKVKIAVGVQNPDSDETGIASLNPLDDEMTELCEKRKLQYLTDDMMDVIEKKDADLHEQLVALRSRGDAGEEEVEEVEEDDE